MHTKHGKNYDTLPQPLAIMAKTFENGSSTREHNHPSGQVLYATEGLMVARTPVGVWAVPTGHALLIPPLLLHEIEMHGRVKMLTAYITADMAATFRHGVCSVILVSKLLDALLQSIAELPSLYEPNGRGERLAALILDEVKNAPTTSLALPMPHDEKLRSVCQEIIDQPRLVFSIEEWAEKIGIGRRTLTRRIRQETGLSFGEWCRRWRLLRAQALEAEGVPFKLVASQVGYQSPQALRTMIRQTKARNRQALL
jgi:AraC-like DNA-binding protein